MLVTNFAMIYLFGVILARRKIMESQHPHVFNPTSFKPDTVATITVTIKKELWLPKQNQENPRQFLQGPEGIKLLVKDTFQSNAQI